MVRKSRLLRPIPYTPEKIESIMMAYEAWAIHTRSDVINTLDTWIVLEIAPNSLVLNRRLSFMKQKGRTGRDLINPPSWQISKLFKIKKRATSWRHFWKLIDTSCWRVNLSIKTPVRQSTKTCKLRKSRLTKSLIWKMKIEKVDKCLNRHDSLMSATSFNMFWAGGKNTFRYLNVRSAHPMYSA